MPEQKPLRPGQRNVCYALVGLAPVALSLGLYSGLESVAVPMYAFVGAGGSVALRAYDKFLVRGGEHGHDRGDWSAASRELSLECGAPSRE
jgi:hypothetical protein